MDPLLQLIISTFQARARQALGFVQAQPTSYFRTRAHNAAVGGDPYSQHLIGLALDVAPLGDTTNADLVRAGQAAGLVVVDEGDHVHWQLFPAGLPALHAVIDAVAV